MVVGPVVGGRGPPRSGRGEEVPPSLARFVYVPAVSVAYDLITTPICQPPLNLLPRSRT